MASKEDGLIEALEPVAKAFRAIGVRFYVAGSVASSYHGASRSTMDVDLVADLNQDSVESFHDHLVKEFYVSKPAMVDAIARKSCFNLIHLSSSFKVDIFILKDRPFDQRSIERAKPGKVDIESDLELPIASPEDTVLSKLEWYRLGNEVSERQWEDVVRVMKILGADADHEYLQKTASELNVDDLLQRLLDATN